MRHVTLWNNLSPGRMRCLFASVVLCTLLAFSGALLLGAEEAQAEQLDDASGGTNQLGGAAGSGTQGSGSGNKAGGANQLSDAAGGAQNSGNVGGGVG